MRDFRNIYMANPGIDDNYQVAHRVGGYKDNGAYQVHYKTRHKNASPNLASRVLQWMLNHYGEPGAVCDSDVLCVDWCTKSGEEIEFYYCPERRLLSITRYVNLK